MAGEAVIFIPGVKGTKLVDTNRTSWDTIWSGIQSNFETIEDLELTARYDGDNYFDEHPEAIIRAGEIERLAYGEFIADLDTKAPIYIFNYDWWLSAGTNGKRLGLFMEYLIDKADARSKEFRELYPDAKTPIRSFNIVTHSMGCFVLRAYMAENKLRHINKVVFTVPPFLGSLDLVSAVLIGEGFFPTTKGKIRKLIRGMPGPLELLPQYAGASRWDAAEPHDFFNFQHWQSNIVEKKKPSNVKMTKALPVARDLVKNGLFDLAELTDNQKKRILVIARDGKRTWQSVRIENEGSGVTNYVNFNDGRQSEDGDGTVPHISSCHFADKGILTLAITDSLWFIDYGHAFVLKDERVQKLVNRFLFRRGPFEYDLPGGAVEKVTGLEEISSRGLSRWSLIIEDN